MIAALDMYNWPESADVFQHFWVAISDGLDQRGINAPTQLCQRDENLAGIAASGDLLLGQICGITYARANAEKQCFVNVGAFACDDDGLAPGEYCSVLIAPKGHMLDINAPSTLRAAINGYGSLSGWIVLANYFSGQSQQTPFKEVVLSGGHRQSAQMVASAAADIAAIDIISWQMLNRFSPDITTQLEVIGRTLPRPGLPLVTSCHHDPATIAGLKAALDDAVATPKIKAALAGLGITGLALNSDDDYRQLLRL